MGRFGLPRFVRLTLFGKPSISQHEASKHWRDQLQRVIDLLLGFASQNLGIGHEVAIR